MNIKTREENPSGNGEVEAPIVLVQKITSDLDRIIKNNGYKKGLVLNAHPFIAAYLTKGFPSIRSKWFLEHKKWVKVLPRDAYTYLEYRFKDKTGKVLN
jgi:ribonuclease G